ncbi:hypothetical protein [Couchioplanes azureus]|uniref:hypothetical protein n=1 Tax=Couchioplanes caeruleus TaxID=56438 RepID=UPI0016715979|nr:hypothetical protein [Couchioplanes caeruleus]
MTAVGLVVLAAAHRHGGMGTADALLLAGNAVLVVVSLGLLLRRPRVRARADGRWRLPAADRRPGGPSRPPAADRRPGGVGDDEPLRR